MKSIHEIVQVFPRLRRKPATPVVNQETAQIPESQQSNAEAEFSKKYIQLYASRRSQVLALDEIDMQALLGGKGEVILYGDTIYVDESHYTPDDISLPKEQQHDFFTYAESNSHSLFEKDFQDEQEVGASVEATILTIGQARLEYGKDTNIPIAIVKQVANERTAIAWYRLDNENEFRAGNVVLVTPVLRNYAADGIKGTRYTYRVTPQPASEIAKS